VARVVTIPRSVLALRTTPTQKRGRAKLKPETESSRPEAELRPRDPEAGANPNLATYKAYSFGRLRGAVIPIEEDEDGNRWQALALDGEMTFWRYRDQARDYLCGIPIRGATVNRR
jgi:hypothetical protein